MSIVILRPIMSFHTLTTPMTFLADRTLTCL